MGVSYERETPVMGRCDASLPIPNLTGVPFNSALKISCKSMTPQNDVQCYRSRAELPLPGRILTGSELKETPVRFSISIFDVCLRIIVSFFFFVTLKPRVE